MKRILRRTLLTLAIALAVVYLLDWGVWGVRMARGGGMDTVAVTRFHVAELKGGKEEMYPDGEGPEPCSISLFPHGGAEPCWYMAKHPVIFER